MRLLAFAMAATAACAAFAADGSMPPSKIFDQQVSMIESELVPLADAMPAEKYNFKPVHGEFSDVRTFAQQVKHVAIVIHMCAASVLGESIPDGGAGENGPASLTEKDQIVKYLKDAFAHAHKATASLTEANLMDMIVPAFGKNKVPRMSMAAVFAWHSFDHYGQMAVYARMNGIVPPASKR